MTDGPIPIIDVRDPEAAKRLTNAFQTVGFAQIVGHGIDPARFHAVYDAAEALWALPDDGLDALRSPIGHPFRGVDYGLDAHGDRVWQRLQNCRIRTPEEAAGLGCPPELLDFFGGTVEPDQPGLSPAIASCFAEARLLGARLTALLALALNVGRGGFTPYFEHDVSYFAVQDYPAMGHPCPGGWRLGEHSDSGALTMLHQRGDYEGLQLRAADGGHVTVPILDEGIIVNVGDLMARWTNDLWPATPHAVIDGPVGKGRTSIAVHYLPSVDVTIAPLAVCVDGTGPQYPPRDDVRVGSRLLREAIAGPAARAELRGLPVRTVSNTDPALASFWHPVATIDALKDVPLHVELLGRHYVLARLGAEVVAFVDSCPHRSFPLSEGAIIGEELRCPYHGYRFNGAGRCTAIPALPAGTPIPARADLQPLAVTTALGLIWLAPETPKAPLPLLPEFDDPAFGKVMLGPYTWRAGAAQITDNFLDVSHFPFVHAGTFGLERDAVVPPFTVERHGLGFDYGYVHTFRNGEEISQLQGIDEGEQQREMRSQYIAPFGTVSRISYEDSGVTTVIMSAVAPSSATTSRLFSILLSTDFADDDAEAARTFEEKILFEDQLALEQYREPEMVLDVAAQFHTGADRMTVEYRRILAEILAPPPPADKESM